MAEEKTLSNHRLFKIFNSMKARCYNPNSKDFKRYGAKGIGICDKWLENTQEFVRWSREEGGYYDQSSDTPLADLLSIDRIDPTQGYCPENCQWITFRENCERAHSVHVTVGGRTNTLRGWSRTFNLKPSYFNSVHHRHGVKGVIQEIRKFLRQEKVAVDPVYGVHFTVEQLRFSLVGWSRYFNVPERYFSKYYQRNGEDKTIQQIQKFLNAKQLNLPYPKDNQACFLQIDNQLLSYVEWSLKVGKGRTWCWQQVKKYGEDYVRARIKQLLNMELTTADQTLLEEHRLKDKNKSFLTVNQITLSHSDWSRKMGHCTGYVKYYLKKHGEAKTVELIQQFLNATGGE